MHQSRCSRTWEVEAGRDGRLTAQEIEQFGRHIASCADCRREQEFVEDLGRGLRNIRVPTLDQLSLRRLRGHVLEAADEAKLAHGSSRLRMGFERTARLALVLTFLAVIVALVHERSPTTTFTARDLGGARWSARDDGAFLRVDLLDGTLELHVERPARGKPMILHVPDGEIEDVGTTFRVSVARGRTERIDVDEGKVIARLDGAPTATIGSGEHWTAPPSAPTPLASWPVTSLPAAPSTITTSGAPSAAANVSPPSSKALHRTLPKPGNEATPEPAPAAFPSNGSPRPDDDGTDDAHVEDRAYVEVVELLRAGRTVEAREAARHYLARFPRGFRRKEMARLASD